MKPVLQRLWKNEDGAEVVQWVFVVALLIGVAVGSFRLLGTKLADVTNAMGDQLTQQTSDESNASGDDGDIVTGTRPRPGNVGGIPGGIPMRLTDGQRPQRQ